MSPHLKPIHIILIFVLIVIFVISILWFIPKWQVDIYTSSKDFLKMKEPIELENDARRTWVQILIGTFFLITAYLTWRRVTATEKQVQIAQEGQITERFTRAIDQIGNREHIEVRLGGIYALERIAKDSQKDHWTIMEILSSYVRVNAPWKEETEQSEEKNISKSNKSKDSQEPALEISDITSTPTDIQAILTVIGRRTLSYEEEGTPHIDLSETNLQEANLSYVHFENFFIWRANLQYAYLFEANLQKAYLEAANLQYAHLFEANLQKAYLEAANLQDANLAFADLQKANLEAANLQDANLAFADLRFVQNLTVEQLSEVKTLYEAKLDAELLEKIKEKYPHLLENPKKK